MVVRVNNLDRDRNNGYKLEKFRFRRGIGRNWFPNRIVDEWNEVSNYNVSAEATWSFRKKIKQVFG